MSLPKEVEVIIIGAGVVGLALARELSRYDLDILVIEKEVDVCFGTSKANSGIIHSGVHDRPGTLKAALCVAGNRLFPAMAEELDFLYSNNGALVVAHNISEMSVLEELRQNGIANGVTGLSIIQREELLGLEPKLSPNLTGALLIPTGGIVAPFDLAFALMENALANGVKLRLSTEVTGIKVAKKNFLVQTNSGLFQAKFVINTAGIHSGKIARMIGDDSFAIVPKKGEEYLLDQCLEGLVRRTIFPLPGKESKGILVIPTVDGNIMIGPTAKNVDSFADLTTSIAGWQEIYQEVSKLVPSLSAIHLIASFAGLRAISDQEDFIIGTSAIAPRFFNVAGIKSPGLTAAPAIAQYLVELLKENGLHLKPRRWFHPERRVTRLRYLSHEKQAELMKKDPAYANIVCRCELISEREICEAIRRGATTIDGIKLRTRAGMGRCQGGFCTLKLIEILSKELGILPEAVTKKGPDSFLLMGRLRDGKGEADYE